MKRAKKEDGNTKHELMKRKSKISLTQTEDEDKKLKKWKS